MQYLYPFGESVAVMEDVSVVNDIVTQFFLNTCRLRPQLSNCAVQGILRCCESCCESATRNNDDIGYFIPLTTESVAEFYIDPPLPHVGDVDVLYHLSTQLAIPRGHPPSTQLPAEFHNYVRVSEIIGSHLPGYVYLMLRYKLAYCTEDEKYYDCVHYDDGIYLSIRIYFSYDRIYVPSFSDGITLENRVHGPAMLVLSSDQSVLSIDRVCHGRHKPLTGQHDRETTTGRT